MPLLPAIASAVGGQIMGMWNDNRQYQLNKKNMALQVQAQKELTDYNKNKQMEMWKETGPVGMAEQLGLAGMSKALMYGGSGAGGQTASVNTGSVGQGGGQASDQIQNAMGLALMKAQKENIEADTQNKLADAEDKKGSAGNRPTIGENLKADTILKRGQQKNVEMDTTLKDQQQWGIGLDNAMKDYLRNYDENGNEVPAGEIWRSIAGQTSIAEKKKLDQEIKNIAEDTRLLAAKGLTETEIMENLKTTGKMQKLELQWMDMGLTKESLSKFLTEGLKRLLK